jgi:hypothetical protein
MARPLKRGFIVAGACSYPPRGCLHLAGHGCRRRSPSWRGIHGRCLLPACCFPPPPGRCSIRILEHHYSKITLGWTILVLFPMLATYGSDITATAVLHTVLLEYLPFIILLSGSSP